MIVLVYCFRFYYSYQDWLKSLIDLTALECKESSIDAAGRPIDSISMEAYSQVIDFLEETRKTGRKVYH
jgi:hypothetical protein